MGILPVNNNCNKYPEMAIWGQQKTARRRSGGLMYRPTREQWMEFWKGLAKEVFCYGTIWLAVILASIAYRATAVI